MKQNIYYTDLHSEHMMWSREMDFYKEEINFFEKRLEEIVVKYTNKDVLAELSHFQNNFIRQKEVVDEIKHEITINEDRLQEFVEGHPVAIDHVHFADHKSLRDQMNTFRKIYVDLKNEYFKFLSKYM